jgi:hypothetical protein
VIQELEIV